MEKIYIRIKLFHLPKREDIAWIDLIELSPPTFNHRVKYRIEGHEEQYSFGELIEELREKTEHGYKPKYFIKRGQAVGLFVVNAETGQKHVFGIDYSKYWPVYTKVSDFFVVQTGYIEITPYLEKIGIL